MEQHLATEHDGELGKESPATEKTPAENPPVSAETIQNTSSDGVTASAPEEAAPDSVSPVEPSPEAAEPAPKPPDELPVAEPAVPPAAALPEIAAASPAAETPAPAPAAPKPPEAAPKPPEAIPVAPQPPSTAFLEQWQQNERMRHIPPISWIVAKVDGDVRKRLEMFLGILESVPSADPRHRGAEEALLAACRSLDRLAEAARRTRSVLHPPNEIAYRIPWSVNTAVSILKNTDANTFDRRQPFQTFERSVAEAVYGALVIVLRRIDMAADVLREIDPTVDEKLYGPLVQLVSPLPTSPIA